MFEGEKKKGGARVEYYLFEADCRDNCNYRVEVSDENSELQLIVREICSSVSTPLIRISLFMHFFFK